jgi:eukaryotic-like serine/threonine-protein kinase
MSETLDPHAEAPAAARQPSLSPDDPRVTRAMEEYLAALEAGRPLDRHDFLARHAGIAGALARCLDGLEFLQAAAPELHASAGDDLANSAAGLQPEGPLGDFRLVRELGRGGMGVVYEAVQISLGRRVALKVLPFAAALDSRQLLRFKNEAQAAAQLHHQHIVPVYGVGCERGVHYYAMQYIEGHTLAAVVANLRAAAGPTGGTLVATAPAAALSTERSAHSPSYCRTVARIGVQAALALEHAHEAGVVHRDIKPANLLVDERGKVWVTDFGLAHCLNQPGLTMSGDLVGTLRYMSPEQALAQRGLVDHRTDLYSLGVTLYELLTLEPAFNGRDRQELLRQIACDEPRPARLLNPALPAELETIVHKAIEKNPAERYATAQELSDDLERFLRNEPIRARRPTLAHKAKKWARRNRPLVWSLAVSGSLLLVLAVIGLAISNAYIAQEKKDKEQALEAAEANLLLARQAVDEMYTQVAEELNILPHMQPFQRNLLQKALRFYQEFAGRKSGDPLIRLERAAASLRVDQIQYMLGQRRQAEQTCRATIAELESLAGELPAEPRVQLALGDAYTFVAGILDQAGRYQEAERCCRQGVAHHEQLVAAHAQVPEYQRRLAASWSTLGAHLHRRPHEAEKCHRDAIALCEKLVAGWPGVPLYQGELANSHFTLGYLLSRIGQPQQAERALRQAINLYEKARALDRFPHRYIPAAAEYELGRALGASGQVEKAERAYCQAIALTERRVVLFPDVVAYRTALAAYSLELDRFLTQHGRPDEAAAFKRSARDVVENLATDFPGGMGEDPLQALSWLKYLGTVQRDVGDFRAAEQTFRQVLTLAGKLAAEDSSEPSARQRLAHIHASLGGILQRAGRLREATSEFRQALALQEQLAAAFPQDPDYLHEQARAWNFLGIVLRGQPGEVEAALGHHRRALALCGRLVAEFPDQPAYRGELVRSHYSLGNALAIAGRCPEAEQAFQEALTASRPDIDKSPDPAYRGQRASILNDLAWLLAACPDEPFRDPARALASARKAVELDPPRGAYWNTLGVAHVRAGHWREAVAAFEKSMKLGGGDSFDWFFLAMAQWQLGNREEARKWYGRALEWMAQHQPNHPELRRFRSEAAQVLGVKEP